MSNMDKAFQISDAGIKVISEMYSDLCDLNCLYNNLITGENSSIPYLNPRRKEIIEKTQSQKQKFKTNFNQDVLDIGHKIMCSAIGEIKINETPQYFNELFTLVNNQSAIVAAKGFYLSPSGHKTCSETSSIYEALSQTRKKISQKYNGIDELYAENVDYFIDRYCQFFSNSDKYYQLAYEVTDLAAKIFTNAKAFNANLEVDSPSR
ncbi:MAG: hypothetical protein IJW59_02290 [Clostridia bacterium]|nr:hypothetical protein [Clostridia bacterium]